MTAENLRSARTADAHFTLKARVMGEPEVRRALLRVAHEIVERNKGTEDLVIVGIRTRGAPLADRIATAIADFEGVDLPSGALDVALYRDDVAMRSPRSLEATTVPADLDGRVVVLVDDVLYTGRTIRAAFDAVLDLGRPRAIRLAVLVDRGHRELPIRADHVGKNLPTAAGEVVKVHVKEIDGEDAVLIGGYGE
ncbi:MAG: pyrimidine operon attenuation protein / uracil phosphoribosyltransferase [Actinomycetota bacterium]|jgi:pyrimidine operon attenuation protein/uracil phosphoribosyltransferase|nr:pyrimidine operon attenuation protein / uracil phosphoribosyltransferase [Actinomycetota bacterium]